MQIALGCGDIVYSITRPKKKETGTGAGERGDREHGEHGEHSTYDGRFHKATYALSVKLVYKEAWMDMSFGILQNIHCCENEETEFDIESGARGHAYYYDSNGFIKKCVAGMFGSNVSAHDLCRMRGTGQQ